MAELRPTRDYTDYYREIPAERREEVYQGEDNWHFYYEGIDWECFLIYALILYTKKYQVEGAMPAWFLPYMEDMEVKEFIPEGDAITLTLHKPGWIRNTMTYYLEEQISPGGMRYHFQSKVEPQPEFLAGKEAVACPKEVSQPYKDMRLKHMEEGTAWNPTR